MIRNETISNETQCKDFLIINKSPLLISGSGSNNYIHSLDFIPASSLMGAYLSTKVSYNSPDKKEEVKTSLVATDAYPGNGVPYLITLRSEEKEGKNIIYDQAELLIRRLLGIDFINDIRLKKGPSYWKVANNNIEEVNIKRIDLNFLPIDIKTRTSVKGVLAHVSAIAPETEFRFTVCGSMNELDEFSKALRNGLYVGSKRSHGFGLIQGHEINSEIVKARIKIDGQIFHIVSIYGSLSYKWFNDFLNKYRDSIFFSSFGIERRKRLDFDRWVIDTRVKSGGIVILKGEIDDQNINCLEKKSIYGGNGGRVIFDHEVHSKYRKQ